MYFSLFLKIWFSNIWKATKNIFVLIIILLTILGTDSPLKFNWTGKWVNVLIYHEIIFQGSVVVAPLNVHQVANMLKWLHL